MTTGGVLRWRRPFDFALGGIAAAVIVVAFVASFEPRLVPLAIVPAYLFLADWLNAMIMSVDAQHVRIGWRPLPRRRAIVLERSRVERAVIASWAEGRGVRQPNVWHVMLVIRGEEIPRFVADAGDEATARKLEGELNALLARPH